MDRKDNVVLNRRCVMTPVADCPWASEMVLNPGIIRDPETGRIHMLVRTSGPTPEKYIEGMKYLPYPIFFVYGYSDDEGKTFTFDMTRPALSPAIEYEPEKLFITNGRGERVPNYVNGCIEDPRLFFIEGECYSAIAGRTFPVGPYWIHDDPVQIMPEWATKPDSPIGNQKNVTTTVLYKVDLKALGNNDYDHAFKYIADLTNPEYGEDRDVFIFPNKMMIDGVMQYVMIHRPSTPDAYDELDAKNPSIVMSASPDLYSFANGATRRKVLYSPSLPWQGERVGGSTTPISLGNGEWLFNFHGKKDAVEGYAQSFMILKEKENDFPEITHLYPERWIYPEAEFELPHKFTIPCVFFTGIVELNEDKLLVSYGGADECAAVMELDYKKIINTLRRYPYSR